MESNGVQLTLASEATWEFKRRANLARRFSFLREDDFFFFLAGPEWAVWPPSWSETSAGSRRFTPRGEVSWIDGLAGDAVRPWEPEGFADGMVR